MLIDFNIGKNIIPCNIINAMLFKIVNKPAINYKLFFYKQIRLHQFITVFQYIIITIMKLFSNNRQKLTLNRIRKPSTPPKLQIERLSGLKMATLHHPLSNKDTNILKMGNSSIFRKESENEADKRQQAQSDLIRCRSISCVDPNVRSNIKTISSLGKLNSSTLQEKTSNKRILEHIITSTCKQLIVQFKQRGILSIKDNLYSIPVQIFNDMITQFGDKIIQSVNKTDKTLISDLSIPKDNSSTHLTDKHELNLKVYNQFSINQFFKKAKTLSYSPSNIDIHLQYQQCTREKKSFWKIIQNYEIQKPTEQNFNFLLNKNKYLKQEIINREGERKKITQDIEKLNNIIAQKQNQVLIIEEKVKQHENSLKQIEKIVKDIENFIHKQPNKILQQQAEGYKQREQELFDLAFLLEQSAPSSIATFVEESIMIPYESFKLTLKSFPHGLNDQAHYVVSPKDMEAFKISITSAFESTIDKLRAIIERKASKIKDFVSIMRGLASYTIGKRQYLTQINKKMAAVSLNLEKKLKILQQTIGNFDVQSSKKIVELRQLINNMKYIYCQAEVFY